VDSAFGAGFDGDVRSRAHPAQHLHHAVDALDGCSSDHLDGRGAPADLMCAVAGGVETQHRGACRIAHAEVSEAVRAPRFRGSQGAMMPSTVAVSN